MKKNCIFLITVLFILSVSFPSMAESLEHNIDVTLTSDFQKVNVGEQVILSSKVLKHGSSFIDEWIGSKHDYTKLENDNYVSQSSFASDEPGLYTITYNIKMITGQGNVIFSGTKSITIEVVDNNAINEVGVKNLIINEVNDSQGNIIRYDGIGEIFVVLSNGDIIDYGTVFVCFGKDELAKDVNITIDLNGEKNQYTVTIVR